MKINKILIGIISLVILSIILIGYLLYSNPKTITKTNKNIKISNEIKILIDKYYEDYNNNNYKDFCENYIVEAELDENQYEVTSDCINGIKKLKESIGEKVSYNINEATVDIIENSLYDEYMIKMPANYKRANNVKIKMRIRKYPDNTVKMYNASVSM